MSGTSKTRRLRPTTTEGQTLRVATYRRISTNEENQPHSLEAQQHSLGEYIARTPGLVFERDYFDKQTGTTTARPGLEDLLDDAADGLFDLVLFYRLDRLARSVYGFMDILQVLQEYGVAVRSATEPFETLTPAGKLMAQMLASFAEFEHDVLMDRIREGYDAKAAKGEWMGGKAPYGYANDRPGKTLTVVPEEAAIVRRAFRAYLAGKGSKAVTEELNSAGLTYRGGAQWNQKVVLRILSACVYAGLIERDGEFHTGLHPAIVSRETYEAAQTLRDTRTAEDQYVRMTASTSEFFLTGTVRCGECGGAIVGQAANSKGRRYRYYACSMRDKRSEAERCHNERVDADQLEAMVLERIVTAYRGSELFPAAAALAIKQLPDVTAELDEQLVAVQSATAKTETALERYRAAFEEASLSPETYAGRVAELEERRESERAELATLLAQREAVNPHQADLVDLKRAYSVIEATVREPENWHAKRQLVGALVDLVVVSPGHQVQVTLRVPTVTSEGPGQLLPGGRATRRRTGTHPRRGQAAAVGANDAGDSESSDLVNGSHGVEWTPFRLGSEIVEVLGIEPRSVGF